MSGIAKAIMVDYVHERVTSDQKIDIEGALTRARSIFGNDTVNEMLRLSAGYSIMESHAQVMGAVFEEIARYLSISDQQFLRSSTPSKKYSSIDTALLNVLNVYGHSVFNQGEIEIELD